MEWRIEMLPGKKAGRNAHEHVVNSKQNGLVVAFFYGKEKGNYKCDGQKFVFIAGISSIIFYTI